MTFNISGLLDLWSTPYDDRDAALAAFGEWYADPVSINGSPVSLGALAERAEQVRGSFSDVRREILDVLEQPTERGSKLAVAFRMGGRHIGVLGTAAGPLAPTGQELTIRVIDLLTIEDGLITSLWMCADELGALSGVGAATLQVPRVTDSPGDLRQAVQSVAKA